MSDNTIAQMNKQEIRRTVKAALKSMTEEQRLSLSEDIWAVVERMKEFADASCVLVYCSLPDEVNTFGFIRRWYGQKRIVVPLVAGDSLVLKEYHPESMNKGAFGILEPSVSAPSVSPSEIDLAFIPGVAFGPVVGDRVSCGVEGTSNDEVGDRTGDADRKGAISGKNGLKGKTMEPMYRLGRGKGFYDRLLPALLCPTVGICFPCQFIDEVPTDPWDIPVCKVITVR